MRQSKNAVLRMLFIVSAVLLCVLLARQVFARQTRTDKNNNRS